MVGERMPADSVRDYGAVMRPDGTLVRGPIVERVSVPAEYGAVAGIVRAVRNGAESAQRNARATAERGASDTERANARGYALGWSSAATLVQLTAADAGATLARALDVVSSVSVLGDDALTENTMPDP